MVKEAVEGEWEEEKNEKEKEKKERRRKRGKKKMMIISPSFITEITLIWLQYTCDNKINKVK